MLANTGLRERVGNGCLLALVLGSNLVDVDIIGLLLWDKPSWLYRRMWTHSLLTAPLLVLLAALLFRFCYRQTTFLTWVKIFLLGVGVHIFMDLINSYGVVLLFPLSYERFELAWVFIIDIYIWTILAVALLSPLLLRLLRLNVSRQCAARIGLALLIGYIGLCASLRLYSSSLLHSFAKRSAQVASFSYVFPEPFGPWRFHGVLRIGDEYRSYLIEPLRQTVEFRRSYRTDERDRTIAHLIDSKSGKEYQWFFKAPLWEKQGRNSAVVSDIRFKSLLLKRNTPFYYRISGTPPQSK